MRDRNPWNTQTVSVTHFNGPKQTIFGDIDKFSLSIESELDDPMYLEGHVVDAPEFKINLKLTKREELP